MTEPRPSANCPPPVESPRRPGIALPPNSCDAHCHVFGPAARFPYDEARTFTPNAAPREQVFALQRFLGLGRRVVVQSAAHGADHSVLLDALAADPDRVRGVALVDDRMPRAALVRLHAAGVRGTRLNFLPHLGAAPQPDEVRALARRAAEFGWHAEVHVQGTGALDHAELIRSLAVPVVIDHLGRVDLREGLDGPTVQALLRLLDGGSVWIKVSGVDRVALRGAPWDDAVALAARFVAHAPDRVLWGTDYPHVNIAGAVPDDGLLTDRLADIAPDAGTLRRLLVDNPERMFDFPPSPPDSRRNS